jgi:hypothetical protein
MPTWTRETTMADDELQPALGTWEAIDTHRAVRDFSARPLEPWVVERLLDAGRRTGSAKNLQRWAFIVCRDRAHLANWPRSAPGPATWPARRWRSRS